MGWDLGFGVVFDENASFFAPHSGTAGPSVVLRPVSVPLPEHERNPVSR